MQPFVLLMQNDPNIPCPGSYEKQDKLLDVLPTCVNKPSWAFFIFIGVLWITVVRMIVCFWMNIFSPGRFDQACIIINSLGNSQAKASVVCDCARDAH